MRIPVIEGREFTEHDTESSAGVAIGRRFDGVGGWMRVAIGTTSEMEKFQGAFQKVVG